MATPPSWEPVESLEGAAPSSGLPATLQALLPHDGQRFRSSAGGSAILLPLPALTSTASGIAMTGEPAGISAVLFLDPPTGEDAVRILDRLGEDAASVGVALPADAAAPGLVAGAPVLSVPVGPRTLEYRLFRRTAWTPADRARLAAAPTIGEEPDVTDERSRWFESRHGQG